MRLDKDTQVCISVAARPGIFGMAVHNAAYAATGLNFIYKAFAVSDLEPAIAGARSLGIRGIGVSMPHKEAVLPLLDAVDDTAAALGAVNTIVNESGRLVGYNTDVEGARRALHEVGDAARGRVLVLGSGGAAKAVLFALAESRPAGVRVASRAAARGRDLAARWKFDWIAWDDREREDADLVINATPLGMPPDSDALPVSPDFVQRVDAVFDLVIGPPESGLVRRARSARKRVVAGARMSLYQAAAQFELYTGTSAPLAAMEAAADRLFGASGVAAR